MMTRREFMAGATAALVASKVKTPAPTGLRVRWNGRPPGCITVLFDERIEPARYAEWCPIVPFPEDCRA